MKISRRFIALVLFLHVFILAGFGHGGGFLAMTVWFVPDYVRSLSAGEINNLTDAALGIVGCLCLLGYILFLSSMLFKTQLRDRLYWIAVLVLCSSLVFVLYFSGPMMPYIPYLFILPFLVTAFWPAYFPLLKRCWQWALK